MKTRNHLLPLAAAFAGLALTATSTHATIIQMNGSGFGNNNNLPTTFASNLSSDIGGVTVSNGATPDIALTWGGDWETHGATTWNHIDPANSGVDILQIEAAPSTVTFTVGATVALVVNSLDIGNASDQPGGVADFAWTISIAPSGGGPDVFSYTTAAMGGGDMENVDISFTGTIGTDYVLTVGNPTNQGRYGAIDNLSFNQVIPGPDLTPPTIVPPTDPADDSTDVAVDTNFVATFSENIALTSTGTITVTDGSETRVVNLDGSADDGDASVLDKVLTITLDADLTNNLSSYDVLISNDAIVDTAPAQNPFAGTVAGDWNFTTVALDLTSPTIVPPTDPADDSTGVALGTNFVATFSENIALTTTGTITVTDGSETRVVNLDGSADDGDASVLDDVLTITLDTDLTNLSSTYDVLISNDAIVDTAPAQNPFAGTVAGDWSFTTSDGTGGGSVIVFNGIAGSNNNAIPSAFGSNLSSDIGGATVSTGGTPNIALAWAGPNGGWDLHGGGGAGFWAALDSDTATTPSVGQMESPTAGSPNTVTFTVDSGWALKLNSVDIGMATDKTDTYYWNVTISEVGGSEVFSTLTAAMDGDGGSGVQALTVALNFTGTLGTDYVLAFNDVDDLGDDTISTNGGAIDNLSFGQVIPGPGGNDFSDWIAGYSVGVQTGIDDDPDGDGVDSGVENFFGTAPDTFTQGLVSGTVDTGANTFTFTHPLNATPADDLTAVYRWSTDLQDFYDDGDPNGAGTTTVDFVQGTPAGGMVTVTATITGTVIPDKLFVDVEVTQN